MTVDELIVELAKLPGDLEVVVDNSRDYEEINPAQGVAKGKYSRGKCSGHFEYHDRYKDDINAVMIV